MKKHEIYYKIDRFGRIKKDRFSTYINNHAWCLPAVMFLMVLVCGIIGE